MNKFKLNLFLFIFIGLSLSFVLTKSFNVKAAVATHVVISEVQVEGVTAADEFVELYNPTGSTIDLTGWRLTRKTSSGVTENNLVASLSGSLASNKYLLIAPAVDYTGSVAADQNYSTASRIAADNTVLLYSDAGTTVVDKVGLGTAIDVETIGFATNPGAGESVERKASSTSDATSMASDGLDEFMGNGEDTDNNAGDFVNRAASQPQNSASAVEPIEASPEPSPSGSPEPSIEPSPSPSVEPSPSPSVVPSPSPSTSPSVAPSVAPSPSVTPSPSVLPSATPSSSPTPSATPKIIGVFQFPNKTLTCTINYTERQIGTIKIRIPRITCIAS